MSKKAGFCGILVRASSESWTNRLRIGPMGQLRRGDGETRRRGDAETRRRGDAEQFPVSPRHHVSASPCHRVTASPRLRVTVSRLHLAVAALAGCFGFSILLTQNRFARKLDLVPFAADALHENLLPFLQFIANVFHTTIRDL